MIPMKKVIILSIVISLITSITSIVVYHKFIDTKVSAFDLKGYIHGIKVLYAQEKIKTEDEINNYIDQLGDTIKNRPKNEIILSSDVILGGPVYRIPYPVKEVEDAANQRLSPELTK